jgi:large subunit ribosomal protein L18
MIKEKRLKRKKRVRAKIVGTMEIPRLSVFRSNQHIYAQIIDDIQGKTLVSANSLQIKDKLTNKEKVLKVAEMLSQKAQDKNIKKIVFDRNGFSYKGRVKLLAEKLRELGLQF